MVPVGNIFGSLAHHRQMVPEFDRAVCPVNLRIGIVTVRTVCPFKTRVYEIFRVAEHGFITKVKFDRLHNTCLEGVFVLVKTILLASEGW